MSELKRCPFCGGEAELLFEPDEDYPENAHRWIIVCKKCAASTGYGISKEAITTSWNGRVDPINNPLTLEDGFEIANADGTQIDYEKLGKKYKDQLCYCDIDGFYIGQNGELVLMDDCGASVPVDRRDYHITACKPNDKALQK